MTDPGVKLTSIRNMTWNGKQGFQTPIEDESFIVDGMGVYGNMHEERGLTCEWPPTYTVMVSLSMIQSSNSRSAVT